jgi:hypothetical protein
MGKGNRPKPWKTDYVAYKPNGNIEAILIKRAEVDETNLVTKAMMLGALQKRTELQSFLEFMKGKKMKTIVEIGTARGGVFYALCKIGDDKAKVISIDMPGGGFGGGYVETDIETIKTFGKEEQKLSFIRKESSVIRKTDTLIRDRPRPGFHFTGIILNRLLI